MSEGTWTAEQLFERYFLPLYPPERRGDLAVSRSSDVNPANNPRLLAQLDDIAERFAKLAPALLGAEVLPLDGSDASIHKLSACLTRETRDRLMAPVAEVGNVPPIVQIVTHGAVYVGRAVVEHHGGCWQMRNPLWESLVELESRAGRGSLAVFQWWLKCLSDAEIGASRLADRYRLHVEVPTSEPERLPIIAPRDRRLPRLKKVRYDTLYKHLRAHAPELRSLGDHFPSPERFAELGFQWLEFTWLGDGRMLLMHGPAERGVHLFWLDLAGYASSAFFPADALPEHRVELDGDRLCVHVPVLGQLQQHEMLWWGA